MKIIKGTDPIAVDHPVWLIFGQPGIMKTSLAYSAEAPLLLDADKGSHRAKNRRDTMQVDSWADLLEVVEKPELIAAYQTIIPDTAGKVLDFLALHLIAEDAKFGNRSGGLSLKGFGEMKIRFRTWVNGIRASGKDLVFIAHAKEEKQGDDLIMRPDITGGSYDILIGSADFIGFLSMNGKKRVLDFSPTDRWVGKNPAQWAPFELPPVEKATHVLADIMAKGRAALGHISEESAEILKAVDAFRASLATMTTPEALTAAVKETQAMPPMQAPQCKALLMDRSKALGFVWDMKAAAFVAPAKGKTTEPTQESLTV